MFSHAFTICSLLALSSAGLLEVTPNTPSRLYLPATSTQQQTNTITRTAQPSVQTFQVPATVVTTHQLPSLVSTVHQVPVTQHTVNTVQSADIHSVQPITSTVFQQLPATTQTQQVTIKSAQPAQIQTVHVPAVSTVYQQVPITTSQQTPSTRQTSINAQVTSTVNTNTLLRSSHPAHIPESTTFQQGPIRQIAIVRLYNNNVGDGTYNYNYETENGITAEEHGQSNIAGAEPVERVHGSYSYTGPDNVRYTVNYVADENGYHAEGAHLPVPPTPVAQVPQVSTRTSQNSGNSFGTSSASVHVVPTTVISQPLQIVQAPGVQTQRQATTVQTSYAPIFRSQQNIVRQSAAVPTSTLTFHQQGTTGYQQTGVGSFQIQNVLQRQSVPSSVSVQQGYTGYTQADAVQTQRAFPGQGSLLPSSVTVQQGTVGYTGNSGFVKPAVLRQSTVVPTSTVTVQHGPAGYSTQQTSVNSYEAQQGVFQHQSQAVPTSTVTVHQDANTEQHFGQQTFQAQQNIVQNQNTVAPSFVSIRQGSNSQQGVVESTVVPSNTVQHTQHAAVIGSVQQVEGVQQGVVRSQNTVVPVTVQQGSTSSGNSQTVYGTVQQGFHQSQPAVSSGILPVHLGRTGLIKQQTSPHPQPITRQQMSGVSSSHVTVQLGTAGYATEQVGDVSSVQILGGSSLQNTAAPSPAQQVAVGASQSQQVVQSSSEVPVVPVVPTNPVNEQQTTTNGQEASSSSQGVVLPDGTVHHGY